MTGFTRRRFLGSAAAVVGAVGFDLLPLSMKRALAVPEPERLRSLRQVEHVVILMQENRSFDGYFGTLSGVRGFSDPEVQRLPDGRPIFYQPDPSNPDGYELPFHLDTTKASAAAIHDLSHAWTAQHESWNGGRMDNWLPAHRAADGAYGPLTMGYLTRQDIPHHYALADAFTICDLNFCSVFGPTWPNRLYLMTGTIDPEGTKGGPVISNSAPVPYTWTTYPERLQAAGISWRVSQEADNDGENVLQHFQQSIQAPPDSPLYQNAMVTRPRTAFMDDVQARALPQVSWIMVPSISTEHPPYLPARGAEYVNDILDALASAPEVWAKTVLFLTYDENDGFFDHVPPPTAPPGTAGEYLTVSPLPPQAGGIAGPIGLGFRVPLIVISPWSRGGWVHRAVTDHTSIIRFLEARFGVREPNLRAWRRRTCTDLTGALRFPRSDLRFPRLPDPAPLVALEEQEVATLPPPAVPSVQTMLGQEPGRRPHAPAFG
ncbi:MAG TPA: alkaline phosphatase family protein [Candidatus Dormibacteraeota bacterium]|nr:alkaline phosphatase family protein [Candidatus Dormibacteraeota bacterium]